MASTRRFFAFHSGMNIGLALDGKLLTPVIYLPISLKGSPLL